MVQKLVTCPHCSNVIDAAALIDGPHYVVHGGGRWCPNPGCHGPLDRKAVSLLSFAYGTAVGGGDGARDSMVKRIGEFEDEYMPKPEDAEPKPEDADEDELVSAGARKGKKK